MYNIDIDSILNKVSSWKNSDKGRQRMKSTINKYVKHNIQKTDAGSSVLTRKCMNDYGNKLIELLRNTALSYDLPHTVAEHFASLKRGKTVMLPDGSYVMEISFTDDLTRQSLQPSDYAGVHNIIAIFNNGYPEDSSRSKAIESISGWWNGEYVHALGSREGLHFMQTAVDDFNKTYGSHFGIHATLGKIYI